MSLTRLDTPLVEAGLRSTNFFNGRILSREDLQREQDAARAIQERLGLAVGDGIVRGFDVQAKVLGASSRQDPVLTVRAGLAINRCGQTVALDRDVDVSLLKPTTAAAPTVTLVAGSFGACQPPDPGVYVTGTGVYLLAVAPARTKQGLAAVSGLDNASASCNAKEVVDTVQFRLVRVKMTPDELKDEARLRNVAAYRFFLAGGVADAARDPFGIPAAAVPLTEPALTDADVPLVLFNWTAVGGLRWVDRWSVRRTAAPGGLSGELPLGPDPRLVALGEAMVLEFQEHIGTLRDQGASPATALATFQYLPPVGILPLGGVGAAVGFEAATFFSGFTTRGPMFIEGTRVRPLLRLAPSLPPIRVGDPELVWLYLVRDNRQSIGGVTPTQPYLVFALGRVPCQVAPRFDVSRWNFANYALDDELTGL